MEAGYNAKTKCYEIQTFNKFRKHDQVFISYGHHDNQKLFLEYGFTIPGNIYNYHQFSWSKLVQIWVLLLFLRRPNRGCMVLVEPKMM